MSDAVSYPEPQRSYYEERAAIAEFDGGLSRQEAEMQAFTLTVRAFGRGPWLAGGVQPPSKPKGGGR